MSVYRPSRPCTTTVWCPRGDLYRNGQICLDCVGKLPLPALRHGCYRGSRLATLPLTVNLVANRRRWWSGVTSFFCVSDAQRRILIQAGMPAQQLIVKPHLFLIPASVAPGRESMCCVLAGWMRRRACPC